MQKEIQKASEKIYHLPLSTIFDDLKILKTKSARFSFAQLYQINLLQLRLCQRHLCQVIKQSRRGILDCLDDYLSINLARKKNAAN